MDPMWDPTLNRAAAGRRIVTSSSRHLCALLQHPRFTVAHISSRATTVTATATASSSSTRKAWYSATPTLFRKFESHHDHVNIQNPKSSPAGATAAAGSQEQQDDGEIPSRDETADIDRKGLLTDTDDLMVGNEGLETIDPKDFPELYPHETEIEGLSQESHPDNERDFENFQGDEQVEVEGEEVRSVLLSDKARSEDEFSWFVDESYPDKSTATTGTDQEEAFVPLWQKNAQRSSDNMESTPSSETPEYTPDSIPGLVKLLESERARNIKVIDMRDKCDWTNWMVIAEGLSERHLGNVADEVYSALKKTSPSTSPPVMEGRDTSTDWVVIDAGSVVIHFMTPEARKERDLEGLWASVKNPLKMKDVEEISWEDVKGKMTKSWKEDHGRSRGEDDH
ncbi:hypothetical protein BGZ95_009098 [Linnemannia exigua]|uniref:DUF143-domain-containing protein n=1 Tax=Linnemannia exigua TaxID=604196 RepID=A0AAD4DDC5_9FUNG|nr:hypothetical protein BGZ95_009098 [Linnemannia exigua]